MVQVSNSYATNSSNVNFKSLKGVKVNKVFKKEYPKRANEILDAFEKNPNVQEFIKKHDVNLFLKLIKGEFGLDQILELSCINVLGEQKSILKKIKDFFTGKKEFQIKHKVRVQNGADTKQMIKYLNKDSRYEERFIETGLRDYGKDVLQEGYYAHIGDENINQDLQLLEKAIGKRISSIKRNEQKKLEAEKKIVEEQQRKSKIPNERKDLEEQIKRMIK